MGNTKNQIISIKTCFCSDQIAYSSERGNAGTRKQKAAIQ